MISISKLEKIQNKLRELTGKKVSELSLEEKQLVEIVSVRKPVFQGIWEKDAELLALGLSYYMKELIKTVGGDKSLFTFEGFHIIEDEELDFEDLTTGTRSRWNIPKTTQLEDCLIAWTEGVYLPHHYFQNQSNIPFYRYISQAKGHVISLSNQKTAYLRLGVHDHLYEAARVYIPQELTELQALKLRNRKNIILHDLVEDQEWTLDQWICVLTFYRPIKVEVVIEKTYRRLKETPKAKEYILVSKDPDLKKYLRFKNPPTLIGDPSLVNALDKKLPVFTILEGLTPIEYFSTSEIVETIQNYLISPDNAVLDSIAPHIPNLLKTKFNYVHKDTGAKYPQGTRQYTGTVSKDLYLEALFWAAKGEIVTIDYSETII